MTTEHGLIAKLAVAMNGYDATLEEEPYPYLIVQASGDVMTILVLTDEENDLLQRVMQAESVFVAHRTFGSKL